MVTIWIALTLTLLLMLSSFIWFRQHFNYFKHRNIPYLPSTTPLGSLRQLLLLRISFGELFQRIYDDPRIRNAKVAGFFVFHTPALIIRDPEIARLILVKHFNSFLNRYESADAHFDDMGALTLPLAKYHNWRDSRRRISELFTSGRMKHRMYPLMLQVIADLEGHLLRQLGGAVTKELQINDMCTLYTTDLTSLLFYSTDAAGLRHGNSALRQQTEQLFKPNILKVLHFMSIFFLPHYTSLIRAKVFSTEYTQFMRDLVANLVAKRRGLKLSHNGDLIDQLLHMQRSKPPTHYVQHPDFIASQAGIILLAGFETSSALLGFTLFELAKQPQLQQRLRAELREAYAGAATLSYETLNTLPYLKMVTLEALRLYPAAAFINRECTPSSEMGFSLQPHLDFVVPVGMPAYISILGLQRDAKFWPNPQHFDPERFTPQRLKSIDPMTYIPFGAGPHGCIGSRLGILQLKLGLAHILRLCYVETCERTVKNINFNPKRFMLESNDDIYIRFHKHVL